MAGYRFCRSDDVALLVQAYNACFRVHFPTIAEMTFDRFRHAIRTLDIWTSSCMVAYSGDDLIGVLIAAKREAQGENLIHSIGIHPEYRRNEHGRHLLDSLSAKLAILGPPLLRAELPADLPGAIAFMEACGYRRECSYQDFELPAAEREFAAVPICFPIDLDAVEAQLARVDGPRKCWARGAASLANRRDGVTGLAIASGERIEAHVLYHDGDYGVREVLAFHCEDAQRRAALFGILFKQVCGSWTGSVRIPRVHSDEIDFEQLRVWGFQPGPCTIGMSMEAQPA